MLLQDLYNRVLGFFRQTDAEKESTKDVACNRLRVVLMQDRTNLTPELLERMRGELVELLSKYLEMDKDALELNLEQDGEQVALMLSIPVRRLLKLKKSLKNPKKNLRMNLMKNLKKILMKILKKVQMTNLKKMMMI